MINLDPFARVRLAHLPTPLEPMDRLRAALGPECPKLYVKRDDCTGLGLGGNKTRKLEFLMGEALAQKADTVITFGALQSNHARQTAVAAARLGLDAELILVDMVPRDGEAYFHNGNLLLDHLVGARVHHAKDEAAAEKVTLDVLGKLAGDGRTPYLIWTGGSSAVGALGYVNAAQELVTQAAELGISPTHLVHATSSAGTQAGLVAGLEALGSEIQVEGIGVYKKDSANAAEEVMALARETADLIGTDAEGAAGRVQIIDGYLGPAYGVPTPQGVAALEQAARTEGLILDPVYSGKAMAGLIDRIGQGAYAPDDVVVFIHTGGAPGLFGYPELIEQGVE